MSSYLITLFVIIIYLRIAFSFVDLSYFKTMMSNLVDEKNADCSDTKTPKVICDENQVMLGLAKMYIVSPERVLMLITTSIPDACMGVSETLDKIKKAQAGCLPPGSDNLYMKLLKTVKFFHSNVCQDDGRLRKKINLIGDCLPELREEFLECEGAPDWYEYPNDTVRCQTLNDIANCNYVKTAMLCGLDSAVTIRQFTDELLRQTFPPECDCKLSKSLPIVEDPMSRSTNKKHEYLLVLTPFIILNKRILTSILNAS